MYDLVKFGKRYLVPFWLWYLVGTGALLVTNWLSVTIPLYLAHGIDTLTTPAAGVDTGTEVAYTALIVALMGAGTILVRTLSRVMFFTPGRLIEALLKQDLFESILGHQPAFLSNWPTGDLFSRVSSDVTMVRLLAGFGTLQVVNATVAIVLTVVQMSHLSPRLAWMVATPILIGLVITQLLIHRMFLLMHRMQQQTAELSDHILASYHGVATIQGFVAEEAFKAEFLERNNATRDTGFERAQLGTVIGPTFGLAGAVNVFILLMVGGPMAIRGEVTLGELVAFIALINFVTIPLRSMSFLLSMVKQGQASLERINLIMDPPPDRPDLPDPAPAPTEPPALSIRDLSFSYPHADADGPGAIVSHAANEPVLRGISIEVPAGGTLGVFGPTGAGKSTLVSVLARLYNPPPGTVFINDVDVLDVDLDGWRREMTLVPQRAFLFSESLGDNITMGMTDPERLERVIRLSALETDVAALPEGLDTQVGESGVMLSGGQRQRTALARALARNHAVLILDDVLSAVDHATEHELIEALQTEGSGCTTVIVAHRISALQHADVVAVLDGGRLVDIGTHAELVEKPGLYRQTWRKQQETEVS